MGMGESVSLALLWAGGYIRHSPSPSPPTCTFPLFFFFFNFFFLQLFNSYVFGQTLHVQLCVFVLGYGKRQSRLFTRLGSRSLT